MVPVCGRPETYCLFLCKLTSGFLELKFRSRVMLIRLLVGLIFLWWLRVVAEAVWNCVVTLARLRGLPPRCFL